MRSAPASGWSVCPAPHASRTRRGRSRGWAGSRRSAPTASSLSGPISSSPSRISRPRSAAELIRAGLPVICTNPRSLDEMFGAVLLVGGALGLEQAARAAVLDMRDEIRQVREFSSMWPDRPRVYFEQWPDPPMAGIRWVSEIVEIAGGRDIFPELRDRRLARDRAVALDEVVRRDPEVILASWCGEPVDAASIRNRPGWERITAVRRDQIHEIDGQRHPGTRSVPDGGPAPDPRDRPAVDRPGLTPAPLCAPGPDRAGPVPGPRECTMPPAASPAARWVAPGRGR